MSKQGLAVTPKVSKGTTCGDLHAFDASAGVEWFYSWSDAPDAFKDCPSDFLAGLEFVPQLWGAGGLPSTDAINTTYFDRASYLIGFNEPDNAKQSNVAPAHAAEVWPALEALADEYGLALVAPCVTNINKGEPWMTQFLGNCTELNGSCRYDHTCMHTYFEKSGEGSTMMSNIESYHAKFPSKGVW